MSFDIIRWLVSRFPGRTVLLWVALAAVAAAVSPNLTKLAADGQAKLLPEDAESALAADLIRRTWPEQSSESLAVLALYRPEGLTSADHDFAARAASAIEGAKGRPADILRVLGPHSQVEIAERLVSRDRTLQIVAVPFGTSFVAPSAQEAVGWLQKRSLAGLGPPPSGLQVLWTGDAVIGRDYMDSVQTSLDRAAIATVFLLLAVLLYVYRSLLLAMIPLATIGVALVLSRSLLAWMVRAGWEISPLVELFLVVILFGCGTDFCLFLSWRFAEHWNASNPAGAMRATLKRSMEPLLTSAGTVIVGLSLMGLTHFKLFSSTGPSVAVSLALTVVVCLTLTPALLILLAKHRSRSFAGLTAPSSGFWDDMGHRVLARPVRTWLVTIAVLLPIAIVGLNTDFLQDLFSELPQSMASVKNLNLVSDKFGKGRVAPLTVVMKGATNDVDLRTSEGLALIDDVSRFIANNRVHIAEVRSATQPLGSPKPLEPARIASRLQEVDKGFARMADGAAQLRDGLSQGAAKLQAALRIEKLTGLPVTGPPLTDDRARESVASGLRQASAAIFGGKASPTRPADPAPPKSEDPRQQMLRELKMAAEGAGQIADGARRAHKEVAAILADPVGHHALDRLLITPRDIQEHPELLKSFAAYLSPDNRAARIDVEQTDRMFSPDALDQVLTLRRRLREYLNERGGARINVAIAGANAGSADVWALTRSDQRQTWIIVPLGVFLVLLVTLRDGWACLNLVGTMLLTYAFALGTTHLIFVNLLGAEGLDWKVPYFLFVLLVAVGVDYNVFLMTRLQEEAKALGLKSGINRAIAQTGGLISSAAAITACSFASFLFSPLASLRQLGFALVIGIAVDAVLVRPLLVPIGHWLIHRRRERKKHAMKTVPAMEELAAVAD